MALAFVVDVDTPIEHCIIPDAPRPITACVIHDTETHVNVATRAAASWHYEIDRDGTLRRYVSEENIAFHVAAFGDDPRLNRIPRPAWLRPSPYPVSDVNFVSIGIETVSDAQYRAAGQPYTPAQYAALRALLADLGSRYGALPIVGHGELQTDRSDPVAFDWSQVGRTLPAPVPAIPIVDVHSGGDMTADEREMLDLLAQRQVTTPQLLRELYAWSDETLKERNDLETEVAALRQQQSGAQATGVTLPVTVATVTYADGRAVPVPVTLAKETP